MRTNKVSPWRKLPFSCYQDKPETALILYPLLLLTSSGLTAHVNPPQKSSMKVFNQFPVIDFPPIILLFSNIEALNGFTFCLGSLWINWGPGGLNPGWDFSPSLNVSIKKSDPAASLFQRFVLPKLNVMKDKRGSVAAENICKHWQMKIYSGRPHSDKSDWMLQTPDIISSIKHDAWCIQVHDVNDAIKVQ